MDIIEWYALIKVLSQVYEWMDNVLNYDTHDFYIMLTFYELIANIGLQELEFHIP